MTVTRTALFSNAITLLDSTPRQIPPSGEGSPAQNFVVEDVLPVTAAWLEGQYNYARVCRFPAGANVKKATLHIDAALDTHDEPTLTLDFNVAFSDGIGDGTPAVLQQVTVEGQTSVIPALADVLCIPTAGTTTAETTSPYGYSEPNILFGTYAPTSDSAIVYQEDITFPGAALMSSNGYSIEDTQDSLWDFFGFNLYSPEGNGNLRPYPAKPEGFFDVFIDVSTAATTGAPGNIMVRIEYTL